MCGFICWFLISFAYGCLPLIYNFCLFSVWFVLECSRFLGSWMYFLFLTKSSSFFVMDYFYAVIPFLSVWIDLCHILNFHDFAISDRFIRILVLDLVDPCGIPSEIIIIECIVLSWGTIFRVFQGKPIIFQVLGVLEIPHRGVRPFLEVYLSASDFSGTYWFKAVVFFFSSINTSNLTHLIYNLGDR